MGILLLLIGLAVLGFGFFQHLKGKRILAAPFKKTGDLASNPTSSDPKGAMSTEGAVVPPAQELLSPCSKTPCLYYEVEIVREWEKQEQTQDGVKKNKGSTNVETLKQGAVFALNDGSGAFNVDASKGGDFDSLKKTFEKKNEIGMFVPGELTFGELRMQTPSLPSGESTKAFRAVEKVVPATGNLFVLGKLEGGALVKPGWRSMLFSSKGRDGLLASTAKKKKVGLIAGGVLSVAAIPLMIFGPSLPEGNGCKSELAGAVAKCSGHMSANSGKDYAWTVTQATEYHLEAAAPAGKKYPVDPHLTVKDSSGKVIADALSDGDKALLSRRFEPGSYTVNVKDSSGKTVKGGYDFTLEIRGDGLAPAGKPAVAAKGHPVGNLGLSFEVDEGTDVGEPLEVLGSYTYPCCGGGSIQISPVKAGDLMAAKSLADAKKEAELFDKSKITKAEATADGWRVEYNHESGMGPMHKVSVRRTIAGKAYNCEATGSSAEKAQEAARACTSLQSEGSGKAAPGVVADAPVPAPANPAVCEDEETIVGARTCRARIPHEDGALFTWKVEKDGVYMINVIPSGQKSIKKPMLLVTNDNGEGPQKEGKGSVMLSQFFKAGTYGLAVTDLGVAQDAFPLDFTLSVVGTPGKSVAAKGASKKPGKKK